MLIYTFADVIDTPELAVQVQNRQFTVRSQITRTPPEFINKRVPQQGSVAVF